MKVNYLTGIHMISKSLSRIKNSKRNMVTGLVTQILNIILPFVVRTVLLYTLGSEYTGLNGLFTSILSVLNMADLGFTTAVVFALYSPVEHDDHETICSILAYLRKVYKIVGVIILGAGLIVMPFLPYLISGSAPSDINIYILFAIYLANTSVSYIFFGYKNVLFEAYQRKDITNTISAITSLFVRITQIVVLLTLKNYYVYVLALPIGSLLNNLIVQFQSKKYFDEIAPRGILDKDIKDQISKQIHGLMIDKISGVARNAFDNIILSTLFGLTAVAIYDNYYYIYNAIYGIMLVLTNSMGASVGNSIVKDDIEKNYKDFNTINFGLMWINGFCTCCLFCLYQPFMTIWLKGDETMLFSFLNMTLMCGYFFAINMNNARNLYESGSGLYYQCRIWYLTEAIANLLLNIVLGKLIGISGIIVATLMTIVVFNFILRTTVTFKYYFKKNISEFYFKQLFHLAITCISCVASYFASAYIPVSNQWLKLFVILGMCLIIPNLIFLLCYGWTKDFKNCLVFVKKIFVRNKE